MLSKLTGIYMKLILSCIASMLLTSATGPAAASLILPVIPYPIEAPADARQFAGTIELTALKGTDLYANTDGTEHADNTARVLFTPVGDFIFSAKVTGAFKDAYEGGALIVYADANNWIKLLFENPKSGKPGISSTVSKGGIGDDAHHGATGGNAIHLKIARLKQMYVLYTSSDGLTWNMVRTVGLPSTAPVRIGLSAQSPVGPQFKAQFSDLRFRSATFKDYWQGE